MYPGLSLFWFAHQIFVYFVAVASFHLVQEFVFLKLAAMPGRL
jgi:hypothetical protein